MSEFAFDHRVGGSRSVQHTGWENMLFFPKKIESPVGLPGISDFMLIDESSDSLMAKLLKVCLSYNLQQSSVNMVLEGSED